MKQPASKKTILILQSNPEGTGELQLSEEVKQLKQALRALGENKLKSIRRK
jgi:hypothetical protein